jgi:hypothetical protein
VIKKHFEISYSKYNKNYTEIKMTNTVAYFIGIKHMRKISLAQEIYNKFTSPDIVTETGVSM